MSKKNAEEPNPEKNLIKMRKVIGVSSRIHELALKRKKSPTLMTKDEEVHDALVINLPVIFTCYILIIRHLIIRKNPKRNGLSE